MLLNSSAGPGAGALRQPHDGAELDIPIDLGIDLVQFAGRFAAPRSSRADRRMRPACVPCVMPLPPASLLAASFTACDDFRIGGAAAEIAGEIVPDLVVVRIGMLLEQLARHQDEAGRAEAALGRAAFEEGLLHRDQLAVRGECSTVTTVLAVGEGREIETTRHRRAVDQHRAAAAQALRAAFARAEQVEALLQHFDEILVRRDLGADLLAVEGES